MNINNLDLAVRMQLKLKEATRQLENIKEYPHMLVVSYSGNSLGSDVKYAVLDNVKAYYQNQIDVATKRLTQLGVDLSPLPLRTGEEEEE